MSLKESNYSFLGGDILARAELAKSTSTGQMAFDWDKAAAIIKEHFEKHHDLSAEAGLQGDWNYTGGLIFKNGLAVKYEYTYLSSNWAVPTLILSWDGEEQMEVPCFCEENNRFNSGTKWDDGSLAILGLPLLMSNED